MSSVTEIDLRLSTEEAVALKPEEKEFYDAGIASLTPAQAAGLNEVDRLQIVRGYQTYDPRKEETNKAFKMIADWRDTVGYKEIMLAPFEGAEKFHSELWTETMYGNDKYGHVILSIKFKDCKTDEISKIPIEDLLKHVGQKLAACQMHQDNVAKAMGKQTYKKNVIIDLSGAGMSLLGSTKRNTIQKVMNVGSDYFPESVWKIYVVNAPMIFRAMWGIIKPWVHPITQAKVMLCGAPKEAMKRLVELEGASLDAIPDWMGGTNKGEDIWALMQRCFKQRATENAAAASPPAAKVNQSTML